MTEEIVLKIVGAVIALFAGGVAGRSIMKRRISKDRLAVAADDGHIDIIAVLREERAELTKRNDILRDERDEAIRQHSAAMLEIGGLRKEVEHLTDKIGSQSAKILEQSILIEGLQRKVDALTDHISSLMGLKDVGLRPPGGAST